MELSSELFQEMMFDHYRRPRNAGSLPVPPATTGKSINPSCGDEIEVWTQVDDDQRLSAISFIGAGCAISQASASLMTVKLKDRSLEEVATLIRNFHSLMEGKLEELPGLGDLNLFAQVRNFPARIQCTLVAWQALERALERGNSTSLDA